jgi:murein DD-endopeptidase MepM/ murein hydrolase activator NlpD
MLFVLLALLLLSFVIGFVALYFISSRVASQSLSYIQQWFGDSRNRPALINERVACPNAPFLLPSTGLIGLLWDDPTIPYNILNPHTGLDIFGDGAPGSIPIYAAYDGFLSRQADWVSTVIIRHADPLVAGRTIWTYYTHMASEGGESYVVSAFPAGSSEIPVAKGQLLGYQGLYSPGRPIGLHLHFSIVLSAPEGGFLNEARIANTIDPSPYFGMDLDNSLQPVRPIICRT